MVVWDLGGSLSSPGGLEQCLLDPVSPKWERGPVNVCVCERDSHCEISSSPPLLCPLTCSLPYCGYDFGEYMGPQSLLVDMELWLA